MSNVLLSRILYRIKIMVRIFAAVGLTVLGGLSVASLPSVRTLDARISLTIQATTATQALIELGNAAHVSLTTSPQTAGEIITLRLKDVPLQEAMHKIALATNASWKQEGEGFRLVRTADQQRAERDTEFKQDVAKMKLAIQKRALDLAKLKPWNGQEGDLLATRLQALIKSFNPTATSQAFFTQASQLSQQAPIGRALTKIMTMLDAKELAALPDRYRAVWSSNPTAMQRPLPSGIADIVDQFLANQAEWVSTLQKFHVAAPNIRGTTYWVGDFGDFQETNNSSKITIVLLTAYKWSRASALNFELSCYDAKGKKVCHAQTSLASETQSYLDAMKDTAVPAGEKPIVTEPLGIALLDSIPRGNVKPTRVKSREVMEKLTHPEAFDPLRFLLSPSLIQAAEIKGLNMVACIPDNAFYSAIMGTAKEITVEKYLQRLAYFNTTVEKSDGWMVVSPSRPSETRENRADRKELGRYVRRIASGEPLSIDEHAAFALSLPDTQSNFLPSLLAGIWNAMSPGYFDPNMLRLYGTLTTEQRNQMQRGGLTFGALGEKQLEYVNRMVYGANSTLQFTPQQSQQSGGSQIDWDLFYNGLMHESTESLPTGIPEKGFIKLVANTSYVVMATEHIGANMVMPNRTMDASTLAWQKYSQDHHELFPWMAENNQRVDLSKVQYGKRTQMLFTFQFTPVLSLTFNLEEKSPGTFRTLTLGELPDDFKKQFDEAYASLVQSYANVKPGDLGTNRGTNPPP